MAERSERVVLGLSVGLCVAVAAGHAALYLWLGGQRLFHPFELEWMESGSLEHMMRVLRGEPLYPAPSIDFVPFPYPPLYPYLGAALAWTLGWILEPGFAALRLASLLSSLATALVVGRYVWRETGRGLYGWLGAGIFLGTWRASGLYFDVARLDSLFTFLLVAAVYTLRFQHGRGGILGAAVLATLACFTKQTGAAVFVPVALWCVWADWRDHGRDLRSPGDWQRSLGFALPLGGLALAGLALLEAQEGGHFLRYVVAVQPAHDLKWGMIGWFFWHDLFLNLPVPFVAAGVWLGMLGAAGGRRTRQEQAVDALHVVVLAGVLVACLVPRIKAGGALNNLIPVHAWLVVVGGLAVARIASRVEARSPDWRRRLPGAVAGAILLQLCVLVRVPTGYLPDDADRRAGRALAARVAGFEGEVLLPVQGFLAAEAGKRVYAHQMPVLDYSRSGLRDAAALRESYERAIREQRFDAVFDSNTAFLRGYLPKGLLEQHYELAGWLFEDVQVLTPISGAPIRLGTLWLPRQRSSEGERSLPAR